LKIIVRNEVVDGVGEWYWPESDNGAWTGPVKDWTDSHRDKIKKYCKKFTSCVMAGGNCGLYPRLLSRLFANVYTFEPDATNFQCLVANCPFDNIHKFNAALGDSHKLIELYRPHSNNVGMHKIDDELGGHIPMLMLDDFVFYSLDLLHLDVEGHEMQVLIGGSQTIARHKPVIFAENGHRYCKDYLEALGYKYIENSVLDAIFIHKDY
jgi:FkbM family methyltransferase